jgi:branched-chain amino acid transport system substrate-binding protein
MAGRTEGSGGEAKKARGVPLWAEPVSRRSVLKGVGVGALALGSGGFLQACSNSIKGSGSSTAGKITIGFVSPQTGALAGFASGDNFVVDTVRATSAYKSGFKVGGKTYTVEILVKDSQSDPNRASEVTSELILQDHADMVVTSSTPETTNPVATVCETQGVPCVSTVVPWEAWYFPRQADPKNPQPFKFTTMYFFGVESFGGCFIPMWDRIPTNKIVAGQWPNDPDGSAFRGAWPGMAKAAGYTMVDGGAYADGTNDYTSMINKFKSHDCEIFTNAPLPPDFNTFWKQAAQQGFKPKLATVAKVLLFPADTEGLGDLVNNIATDSWWGPYMPFKSSLDGMTTKDLADAYQASSGKQWLQTLGSTYSLFEVAKQAMTAADDPHDKNAVAAELFKVNYAGMSGPLDFTVGPHIDPADQTSPTVPGIGIVNPVGVQWKKGTQFPWEMVVVDNSLNSDVPIGGDLVATNP